MKKKLVKLINNERVNSKLVSEKACSTDASDYCVYIDMADCTTDALDHCYKDYAACHEGADDVCTYNYDYSDNCIGVGVEDTESEFQN